MILKSLDTFKKAEFVKNTFKLVSGTAVAQAIPVLVSPLLTRIYSPSDFGLLALFISITSLLAIIVTGKFELAIVLPEKEEEATELVVLSFWIMTFFSILILILILVFHSLIAKMLQNKLIENWLYYVPLVVFLMGGFEILRYYSLRKKAYGTISKSTALKSFSLVIVQLGIGFSKLIPGGLIFGNIFSNFTSNAALFKVFLNNNRKDIFITIPLNKLKAVGSKYIDFTKFSLPSSFLNSASLQIPIFIFSAFFSNTFIGFYSLSQRVLSMPMALIGSAIGQVFFQRAAEVRNDAEVLKNLTWKLYQTLLLVGIIPIATLTVFGEELFGFVFGNTWRVGGLYAQMLSMWILFVFISSPLSTLFYILEKQKEGLIFQTIVFVSRTIVLLLAILIFRDEVKTVFLFGITGAILFFCFSVYLLSSLGISKIKVIFFTLSVILVVLAPLYGIKFWLGL